MPEVNQNTSPTPSERDPAKDVAVKFEIDELLNNKNSRIVIAFDRLSVNEEGNAIAGSSVPVAVSFSVTTISALAQ